MPEQPRASCPAFFPCPAHGEAPRNPKQTLHLPQPHVHVQRRTQPQSLQHRARARLGAGVRGKQGRQDAGVVARRGEGRRPRYEPVHDDRQPAAAGLQEGAHHGGQLEPANGAQRAQGPALPDESRVGRQRRRDRGGLGRQARVPHARAAANDGGGARASERGDQRSGRGGVADAGIASGGAWERFVSAKRQRKLARLSAVQWHAVRRPAIRPR